jgi:hypothetical protein
VTCGGQQCRRSHLRATLLLNNDFVFHCYIDQHFTTKIQGCNNRIYLWQHNILSCNNLDFCCNIAQPFATNDKFLPTKHICNNTINYIAIIL